MTEDRWYRRWFRTGRDVVSKQGVQQRLEMAERALELRAVGLPQAQVDKEIVTATAELLRSFSGIDSIAMQLHSLLIVKTTDAQGKSTVMACTLTAVQLKVLERTPRLLQDPQQLLMVLGLDQRYEAKLPKTVGASK